MKDIVKFWITLLAALVACADTYFLLGLCATTFTGFGLSRELGEVEVANLTSHVAGCLGWQVLMHILLIALMGMMLSYLV